MRKLKLKQQLLLLVIVFVAVIAGFQIYAYAKMYSLISDNKQAYASSFMAQIEEAVMQLHNEINTAAITVSYNTATQEYILSKDVYEKQRHESTILDICINLKFSNNIESIVLLGEGGVPIGSFAGDQYYAIEALRGRYDFSLDRMTEPYYTGIFNYRYPASISQPDQLVFAYVFPIKAIVSKNARLFANIGSCVIFIQQHAVLQLVRNFARTNGSYVYILDADGRVIAAEDHTVSDLGSSAASLHRAVELGRANGDVIQYAGQECILHHKAIPELGWTLVNAMPVNNISSDLYSIQNFSWWSILYFSLFSIAMLLVFFYNLSRPIRVLTGFMQRVCAGDLDSRLSVEGENEIGEMSSNINRMLDHIAEANVRSLEATKKVMEIEIHQKHAQLMALQSQINPHFLYNTLDCIRGIALSRNMLNIVEITTCMADIFRYSIHGDIHTTLRQELSIVEKYLRIISIRYDEKIKYSLDVDPLALDAPAPRMILQPIVENAVHHGLEKKNGDGLIGITGRVEDRRQVVIIVSDNGVGISREGRQQIKARLASDGGIHTGETATQQIGLVNIQRRIKLYIGEPYGIDILDGDGFGTSVRLVLPLPASNGRGGQGATPDGDPL